MKPEIVNFKLLDGKTICLKFYKNLKRKFIAQAPPFGKVIRIDELFFTEFSKSQRISIIYHELWHKDNNLKFELRILKRKPWLIFYNKPIMHAQEFEADLNAFKMTNKSDTLGMLLKLKKLIEKGIIHKKHEKTHPTIEERIRKINELK